MKKHLTEIAFVLDRSGSMAAMIEPAISGFNRLLRDQKATSGDANFTLVLFDDHYEVPCLSLPISQIAELDASTYIPRGSTALLDAIARTIDDLGARLASLPEDRRPSQVIVAILTDGEENASTRHTWSDVAKRIRHQTEVYQWQFLFLGANQDAIATAGRLQIAAKDSANFAANENSYSAAKTALSRKMSAVRLRSQGDVSQETLSDADASLDRLREEEEGRGA